MSPQMLALKLLSLLKHKEDFETKQILKRFFTSAAAHTIPQRAIKSSPKVLAPSYKKVEAEKIELPVAASATPLTPVSIYARLAEKIKIACPELKIKAAPFLKKAGVPDCDVVMLSAKTIPPIYQAIAKAIDQQLALTEALLFDGALLPDLLNTHFKLILLSHELKKHKLLAPHIKLAPDQKLSYLGSSPLIFLDDSDILTNNPSTKKALWQTIKTLLV